MNSEEIGDLFVDIPLRWGRFFNFIMNIEINLVNSSKAKTSQVIKTKTPTNSRGSPLYIALNSCTHTFIFGTQRMPGCMDKIDSLYSSKLANPS